jgi:hypothetical protein
VPQLNFKISADLLDRIDAAKPDFLDRKGFICLLLSQQLTGGSKLPAYCVGAGTTGESVTDFDVLPPPARTLEEADPTPEKTLPSVPSPIGMGEGVGRESERTPRKDPKQVLPNLLAHEDLIRDFWRVKGGSKGDRAWSLLLTELTKIQNQHGDAMLRQQIELAINGKWKGVTLANLERFTQPTKQGGAPLSPSGSPMTAQEQIVANFIRRQRAMEEGHAVA